MNIEKLGGYNPLNAYTKLNSVDDASKKSNGQGNQIKDKLEISDDALKLMKANPKDLNSIKSKIDSGFYNSPEVFNKLADTLLNELKKV